MQSTRCRLPINTLVSKPLHQQLATLWGVFGANNVDRFFGLPLKSSALFLQLVSVYMQRAASTLFLTQEQSL